MLSSARLQLAHPTALGRLEAAKYSETWRLCLAAAARAAGTPAMSSASATLTMSSFITYLVEADSAPAKA